MFFIITLIISIALFISAILYLHLNKKIGYEDKKIIFNNNSKNFILKIFYIVIGSV